MAGLLFLFCVAIYSTTAAETFAATPEKQRKIMNSMFFVFSPGLLLCAYIALSILKCIFYPFHLEIRTMPNHMLIVAEPIKIKMSTQIKVETRVLFNMEGFIWISPGTTNYILYMYPPFFT